MRLQKIEPVPANHALAEYLAQHKPWTSEVDTETLITTFRNTHGHVVMIVTNKSVYMLK